MFEEGVNLVARVFGVTAGGEVPVPAAPGFVVGPGATGHGVDTDRDPDVMAGAEGEDPQQRQPDGNSSAW